MEIDGAFLFKGICSEFLIDVGMSGSSHKYSLFFTKFMTFQNHSRLFQLLRAVGQQMREAVNVI